MLLHAAAGGVGLIFTPVGEAAGRQGDRHRLHRREGRRSPARTAATHTIVYTREDVADPGARADRRRGRAGRLRQRRAGPPSRARSTRWRAAACWSASARRPARSRRSTRCSWRSRGRSSSPGRRWPTTSPTRPSGPSSPASCSTTSRSGRINIEINQRYALEDAVQAHRDLESGRSIGSSVFELESACDRPPSRSLPTTTTNWSPAMTTTVNRAPSEERGRARRELDRGRTG